MAKKILEAFLGESDVDTEDGGMAKIATISDAAEEGMFIKLQSWDEDAKHTELNQFVGKKVKVTVETIED